MDLRVARPNLYAQHGRFPSANIPLDGLRIKAANSITPADWTKVKNLPLPLFKKCIFLNFCPLAPHGLRRLFKRHSGGEVVLFHRDVNRIIFDSRPFRRGLVVLLSLLLRRDFIKLSLRGPHGGCCRVSRGLLLFHIIIGGNRIGFELRKGSTSPVVLTTCLKLRGRIIVGTRGGERC
jgi:hypothetical protein